MEAGLESEQNSAFIASASVMLILALLVKPRTQNKKIRKCWIPNFTKFLQSQFPAFYNSGISSYKETRSHMNL